MSSSSRHLVAMVLAMLLPVAVLHARGNPDDDEHETWQTSARLDVRFTPGLWLPRLIGDVKLGPAALSREIDIEDELSLRDQEPSFRGELEVRKDDTWFVRVSGFDFTASDRGTFRGVADFGAVDLRPGDRFETELSISSVAVEVAMAPRWRWPANDRGRLRLAPLAAVRLVNVDQSLERIGGPREAVAGDWLGVLAGVRIDLRWRPASWVRELHLHAATAFGPALGGDGGAMWQLRAAATLYLTPELGLEFGFRLLHLYLEDGPYELDVGLQGLFLAMTVRF